MAALRHEVNQLRRQVSELRCEVGYWKSRHSDALERNESLREELAQAKGENRKLRQRLFGRKSERRAANERADLLEQAAEEPKPKLKRGARPGQKGHGRRDYSHLPTREKSIEIPENQRVCPRCGKPMRELGETEDPDGRLSADRDRSRSLSPGVASQAISQHVLVPWVRTHDYRSVAAEVDSQEPFGYFALGASVVVEVRLPPTDRSVNQATQTTRARSVLGLRHRRPATNRADVAAHLRCVGRA